MSIDPQFSGPLLLDARKAIPSVIFIFPGVFLKEIKYALSCFIALDICLPKGMPRLPPGIFRGDGADLKESNGNIVSKITVAVQTSRTSEHRNRKYGFYLGKGQRLVQWLQ